MRIARAKLSTGEVRYGMLDGGQFIPLDGAPFERPQQSWRSLNPGVPLDDVRLLAPTMPSKIVAIGRNYAAHAAEHGADVPAEPLIFLKPPSSIVGPGDAIVLTRLSERIEHEAELAVVIGRRARWLTEEDALDYVLGYTCANDVTARDLQRKDGQWSRAKGFDTFCPLGPWIQTDLDLDSQVVRCLVNGAVRQEGVTSQLVFSVPFLLAHISAVMTLEPGDVLLTGTPAGVSPLRAGDWVEVSVSGVGTLGNPVQATE